MLEFICNDPWSNVAEYDLTVTNSTGDIIYYDYSAASASCGIMYGNLSALAANTTVHTHLDVVGRVLRNGENYTVSRRYFVLGGWASGLAKTLGDLAGVSHSDPDGVSYNNTGDAILTQGTVNILAFVVMLITTLSASLAFGFGSGVVGAVVGGFFVFMGWLDPVMYLLAVVAMVLVYASKGVIR